MFDPNARNAGFIKYVENLQIGAAGVSKYNLDALERETTHQNLRALQGVVPILGAYFAQFAAGNAAHIRVSDVIVCHGASVSHRSCVVRDRCCGPQDAQDVAAPKLVQVDV